MLRGAAERFIEVGRFPESGAKQKSPRRSAEGLRENWDSMQRQADVA
jgi:hypothetical protein